MNLTDYLYNQNNVNNDMIRIQIINIRISRPVLKGFKLFSMIKLGLFQIFISNYNCSNIILILN